ncbi:hypothetical protein QR680_005144 [Steinernema hermaphroditum]|uniref:WD repeat-containing protein 89 n=1 Tax=Steinernema hermaphroditum TaxID=289476 RepID=A0AA39LV50_9BILA|nr:hypothetical protein QR680_005144 [Steinernema hermaphroditum]
MHARQSRGGREEEERPLPIRSRADHASRGLRSYQEAADWPEDKGKLTFLCPWPLVAGKGSGNTGFGEDRGRPQWIERRSHSQLLDAREKVGIPRARVTDANSLEAGTSPKSAKKMFCGGASASAANLSYPMAKPFITWYPGPQFPGVVEAICELPSGLESNAKWVVVTNEETTSTVYMIHDGINAKCFRKHVRTEPVKAVGAHFSPNLWKIIVLYEDFAVHFIEPSNGKVAKRVYLKQGLNKGSMATAFAYHGHSDLFAVGYTLDQSVPKAERRKNKKQYADYDDDDAISYSIDLIDMRNPEVPEKTYEELHSSTIQCLKFCGTAPKVLISGGADGLVNWVNVDVAQPEDGLMATNSVISPVATVGIVGNDEEGKTLACCTTDDGRFEFYRLTHTGFEDLDVEVTYKGTPAENSNRFLVDVIASGHGKLPYVTVESTHDGQITMTAASPNGKLHQDLGTFKEHKEMVRFVWLSDDFSERRFITGDEVGGVVGRYFPKICVEKIQAIMEEVDEATSPALKKKTKTVKKKGVVKIGKVFKKKTNSKKVKEIAKKVRKKKGKSA